MDRRLVKTVGLCLALLLVTALLYACFPPLSPAPAPSPTPSPADVPAPALALLGSRSHPLCVPLYDTLEDWTQEEHWSFISYDCQGWAVSQKGQVEDLVRNEHADVVILCSVGTEDETAAWVKSLQDSGSSVIVLGGSAQTAAHCRVTLDAQALGGAIRGQLVPEFLGQRREVLLVVDAPEAPSAQQALDALETAGLSVVEYGSCWGQSQYAQEYLSGALERHPYVSAIFCLSQSGAQGAREALGSRKNIAVLALDCDPDLWNALALGQVDAALAVPTGDVLSALTQAARKLQSGQVPENVTLAPVMVTGENMDTIDLGY